MAFDSFLLSFHRDRRGATNSHFTSSSVRGAWNMRISFATFAFCMLRKAFGADPSSMSNPETIFIATLTLVYWSDILDLFMWAHQRLLSVSHHICGTTRLHGAYGFSLLRFPDMSTHGTKCVSLACPISLCFMPFLKCFYKYRTSIGSNSPSVRLKAPRCSSRENVKSIPAFIICVVLLSRNPPAQ